MNDKSWMMSENYIESLRKVFHDNAVNSFLKDGCMSDECMLLSVPKSETIAHDYGDD